MDYENAFFISYAHADNISEDGKSGFVDLFYEKLCKSEEHQRLFGKDMNVFFDKSDIPNMSDWDNRIQSGLAKSRFLIVLMSPNYFKSEYCAREFDWWMQHEMHRCTLGEGAAPMLIYDVASLQDSKMKTIPAIPAKLQASYPNWLKQIRKIQSDHKFDMHDFLIAKIDDVLLTLRDEVKDKVRHQDIVNQLPYDTYPGYNEKFVGRREKLLFLRDKISTKSGKVISALTGLGGFGKTELALTYGHAFGWDYQLGRFFKPCENCKSIYDAFLSCGILKKYGWEPKGTDEEQTLFIFNRLKAERNKFIAQNTEAGNFKTEGAHVLLILDNVNNLDLISQLFKINFPDFIHIVITTQQSTSVFSNIQTVSVDSLNEDDSVELLRNWRSFENPGEAEAARKIAKLLAGFTLVVELTGAYLANNINVPQISYQSQYKRLIEDISTTLNISAKELKNETCNLMRHTPETIAAVLKSPLSALSFNALIALNYASLMAPDAVALSWLPELCGLNEDDGVKVIKELTKYNLLTRLENEPHIARIHRLVAEEIKREIPENAQKEIIAKIREKCNELLKKDSTFWGSSENSWNITPVSEFVMALAKQWTVETSEEEIDWNLTWMMVTAGDILNTLGKMNEAQDKFYSYHLICKKRADTMSPYNVHTQRDLSISYSILGDLENDAGNITAAWEWYEKSLKIDQRLADMIPDNVDAQWNLSVSYNKLGDMEKVAGNIDASREWYEKVLDIRKQLVEKTPDNFEFLRGLSISYERLGNLENVARKVTAARNCYEKFQTNSKLLVNLIPDDVDAQRILSISYECLGNLEIAAGNVAAAREWYEKSMEIHKRLVDMMPDNVKAQRDLGIFYYNFGYLENCAGNAVAARKWYEKALEISMQLAEQMPDNIRAQRDLSYMYNRLGYLEKAAGNFADARIWYNKSLEIALQLAEKMPDDVDAQRDLCDTYNDLGNLEITDNNPATAKELSNKALRILEPLAEKAPHDVGTQQLLGKVYRCLGDSERISGNNASAKDWYEKALNVFQRLIDKMPENKELQKDLAETQEKLAQMQK